jgi:hypothetical protein
MRIAVALGVVGVALLCSAAAGDARRSYRGARLSLDYKQAPVDDLLRIVGDVGKVNLVMTGATPAPLDIMVKSEPWDQVLDEIVSRSGLASLRTGNTFLIGTPEMIADRKKRKAKRVYKGRVIDVDVHNAEAPAVAKLIAFATGSPIAIDAKGPRPANLKLTKVPSDQAIELLALHTGAELLARPAATPGKLAPGTCAAEATQLQQLRLAGIARNGTKGWALFIDPAGSPYIVSKGQCIGVGATMIQGIRPNTVSLDLGDSETSAELHPRK